METTQAAQPSRLESKSSVVHEINECSKNAESSGQIAAGLRSDLASLELIKCVQASKVLRKEILARFDELCKDFPEKISKLAYQHMAKTGQIFIATLIEDAIDKTAINKFGLFFEKLKQNRQHSHICKLIEEKQNEIFDDVNKTEEQIASEMKLKLYMPNQAPIIFINEKLIDGLTKKESLEQSSSGSASEEFKKMTSCTNSNCLRVYLVYHSDQIAKNKAYFGLFKEKLVNEHKLCVIDFDLAKFTLHEIESEYAKLSRYPIFLIYDTYVNDLLDAKRVIADNDTKAKNVRLFYQLVYLEYLEKNFNERCYLITIDDFSCYNKSDTGRIQAEQAPAFDFTYKWLLRLKCVESDGKKIYIKPLQLTPKQIKYNNQIIQDNLGSKVKYFVHTLKQNIATM